MEALFDPFSFEKKGQAHIGRESGKMDQARQRGRSGCRPFNVSMPKGQDVKGGKAGYVTLDILPRRYWSDRRLETARTEQIKYNSKSFSCRKDGR